MPERAEIGKSGKKEIHFESCIVYEQTPTIGP